MKTNRSARNIVRIRLVVGCLLFIGVTAVVFKAGQLVGEQSARSRAANSETLMPQQVDLRNLIASN